VATRRTQSNIRPITEAATGINERFLQAQAARDAKRHRRRRLIGWLFTVAVFAITSSMIFSRMQDLRVAAAATEAAQASLAKEKATNQKLKTQVKNLQNDDYLQKYVREKYLYTKEGELVFNLPGDK
jgi:cell division protein DivIC